MVPQTAVTERDFQAMVRLVAKPEDLGSADPLPWSVLTGLRQLVPCDNVSFVLQDSDQRETCFDQDIGDLAPVTDRDLEWLDKAFWTHYWDCPPCSYPDSSGDLTSVTTMSDFYSDRELHSAPMYSEWFKPMALEREMMLCLPSQLGRVMRLIFFRGPGPDFSPRDRDILTLLRPHLHEAYRQQRQRQRAAPQLTARQRQVLRLVATGYTNVQIARRMSISEATVRKHLENIFQRLQVTSRTAAVTRYTQDQGHVSHRESGEFLVAGGGEGQQGDE